jgi:O-methyltransferase domain
LNDASSIETGTLVRQILGDTLGYLYPAALRVAARFNVADHLVAGPRTAADLAELTGVHAQHLYRTLRFLATRGVFREDDTGRFHLTPAATLLRTGVPLSVRSLILQFTDEMYWRPTGRLDDAVVSGATAFDDIFGSQFFEYLTGDDDRSALFSTAMAELSVLEQGAIAASYDFPDTGVVIDIAGGRGGMLRSILTGNPGLRGVLFERERVLESHQLDDPALDGRWETATGDFFTSVPAGGDIYLLKRIVHDKTDDDSRRILRATRKAMSAQSRLLIIDGIVPPGFGPHVNVASDVLMLAVFEGRERTEDEIGQLLADADLRLSKVISTPTALSIVEAVPA